MSNGQAIAATSVTLQGLLRSAVVGGNVTLKTPDTARGAGAGEQLNLFLYQTQLNTAWRNVEMPRPVKSGEQGAAPLALNLHYLITAYGDSEADSHRILGQAMSILHDHMLLSSAQIRSAVQTTLPGSDLDGQPERVRITPLPLTIDEISKLWSSFSTNYRVSAAYEVGVILIESQRLSPAALPVLTQGPDDRGPYGTAQGDAQLEAVRPLSTLPAVTLGSTLRLLGQNLSPSMSVRISGAALSAPVILIPLSGGSDKELTVRLPAGTQANSVWAAGFYTVAVLQKMLDTDGKTVTSWASNDLPFGLAPEITVDPPSTPAGTVTLTLTCLPHPRPGQRALLLIAGQQLVPDTVTPPPADHQDRPTTLSFTVPDLQANPDLVKQVHPVRLRIGGVDSLPMRVTDGRLEVDPAQTVSVT